MANIWKKLPEEIPTDGETVVIRVQYTFSNPFQAVWDDTNKLFTSVDNGILYPAWTIARWKSL